MAVLYAPTWRDHLATRPRRAELTDHLDVDAAAARPRRRPRAAAARAPVPPPPPVRPPACVDVTDHPEINDLVLASDVAVLDYSSLRFDFALTGRPMVFLVPDLEDYDAGSRAFLFPFADSAPGPLVRDTDEVVARVRDLAGLRAEWAARARRVQRRPTTAGRTATRPSASSTSCSPRWPHRRRRPAPALDRLSAMPTAVDPTVPTADSRPVAAR